MGVKAMEIEVEVTPNALYFREKIEFESVCLSWAATHTKKYLY
jgi:hypothetical protein